MTTIAEIKSYLHQQVANTEDEKVLQQARNPVRLALIFFIGIAGRVEYFQ